MTTHDPKRRLLLKAGVTGVALGLLPGCSPHSDGIPQAQSPLAFKPGQPVPWVNWAGNQACQPAQRFAPATEAAVLDAIKQSTGIIRAVGAGHSFSPLVPTDDSLISCDLLAGIVNHDPVTLQTEVWAGTRVQQLGPLLAGIGQALPNQPDLDYLSLGGAMATSVHATGPRFGSMTDYVTGLTLATPSGELIECSATEQPEVFQAARTSVGALGLITRMRLQNEAAFNLVEVNRVENTEDVLDDIDNRMASHRHFEMLPLLHSPLCLSIATDIAKPGDVAKGEDDPQAVNTLRTVYEAVGWLPGIGAATYARLLDLAIGSSASSVRVGPSYQVFPHVRVVRFREMEYTVPVDAGPACLREILSTVRKKNLPVCFPLEYRYVKGGDVWLSMFQGMGDSGGCSISVHPYGDIDYKPYFAEIEPIFWKYGGRPHWGKLHTLDAKRLAALYPKHWQDFQEVRRTLDPLGRMLNPHLQHILGA